jgi:HAD superfamily hydrolase (TIGR01509 family)
MPGDRDRRSGVTGVPSADVEIPIAEFRAALFDMDGVVTRTAVIHAAAWKQLFDEYFAQRRDRGDPEVAPFDIDEDYRAYVDGRPRYDGVEAFLASREITLPWGEPDDLPDRESICGLGNRKDAYFWERVRKQGVQAYESTVGLIEELRRLGCKVGIFSASRNAESVLRAAGVAKLFDKKVDGNDADAKGLRGKPDPAMLLALSALLGAEPARGIVFEDAIAGVQAGHSGGFGLVIGINRGSVAGTLLAHGADREVSDLAQVRLLSP